jgi:hypothetical protein
VLLIGLLFTVGAVLYVSPWIVGIVGVAVAVHWARRAADRHADRVEAERRRLAGLVARADQQHEWVLAGDPRGVYGDETVAVPM